MQRINEILKQGIMPINRIYPKYGIFKEETEKAAFISDLIKAGKIALSLLGKTGDFVIDETNREIIDQLWYFITESPKFRGNPQKGIFLTGGIGTGKTVLMLAFMELMKKHTGVNYTVLFPDTIHGEISKNGFYFYRKKILLIDDVCREPEKVPGYWDENPVRGLTVVRNRFACQSYATANFKIFDGETPIKDNYIITKYGAMIFDRMKEAYNFLELTGKSRR